MKKAPHYLFSLLALTLIYLAINGHIELPSLELIASVLVLFSSGVLTLQGSFTLIWMLYAWNNPDSVDKHTTPTKFAKPKYSFTAIVPVRFEEGVIKDTINAINAIDYPRDLKEIVIVARHDDKKTFEKVQGAINEIGKDNIRLSVLVASYPINKPNKLNSGLKVAKNDIVTIFDAEDEPHPDIYKVINTEFMQNDVEVVQSGVQLMNYRSRWFSILNVLEYFFWFKSGLLFFSDVGHVSPLGGNTVFIKRGWVNKVGGWDEECLTEDADIGIRLTLKGARTKVVYDEEYVTREETPLTVESFIKQRTRWIQGFLQIIVKGDWKRLPTFTQKTTAFYVLTAPLIPALITFYMLIEVVIGLVFDLPIIVSMISFVPFYLLLLSISLQAVGIYEFTKAYKLEFSFRDPIKVAIYFLPFVFLLSFAAVRAFIRILSRESSWEKTAHLGVHRRIAQSA